MKYLSTSLKEPKGAKEKKGFTLLELMIAISIFAIVSLLTMGGLSNVLETQEHAEKNMKRLIRFQMAFTIMSREIQQISLRPVRDEYGSAIDMITSQTSDGINGIEFTHQGRFTLGDTVNLQRVAYYLEDNKLFKKVWQVLDRVEDTQPVKQAILDDIDELKFSFYSVKLSGEDENSTTENELSWEDTLDENSRVLAVKVSIISKDYDELYRVFEIAQ
ncbi:MAG: type II secretion system minor pseudopilin GspJ [Gammaproteobacteria bacterium]|nr:type II secretion system minor pseudopilin GspJ [Gammaproteobacteria bacterium]